MMNITKVKYAGEKVRIEYTIDRADGGEADEYTLQSAEGHIEDTTDDLADDDEEDEEG